MMAASLFRYYVIAGLINTIVFAILLITHKKVTSTIILLIGFMMLISFQALFNAFDSREFYMSYPNLSRISWLQLSLVGPLIYLITKKIGSGFVKWQWNDAIHALPFIVCASILLPWFLKPTTEKLQLLHRFDVVSKQDFGWLNQVNLALIIGYIAIGLWQQHKYKEAIKNIYSDVENRRLKWIKQFLYLILGIVLISGLGFYGRKWDIPVLTNFYHYNYIIIVAIVYWLAYKLLTTPDIFWQLPPIDSPSKKYEKSGIPDEEQNTIYTRLLEYIETGKPYLDTDLTIYKLAETLELPRHHLSQVINTRSGKSFYDFINGYRVEEAKRRLKDPAFNKMTIQGIAFDSGFNSKATFNTAFNRFAGMTPSAYRKLQ
jgi:AraC-like DNA-binding protein